MEDGRNKPTLLRFEAPDGRRDVVIEDDGRVLREGGRVCADVWLYNVGESPTSPDWEGEHEPPFRNPVQFANENDRGRISSKRAVLCEWWPDGVRVSVDGIVWAQLERGSKPGKSRLARMDGPAARRLVP